MNDLPTWAPMCARPQRDSSAHLSAGALVSPAALALLAGTTLALLAAPAAAQSTPASRLGNPVTGEASEVVVPPPPSYLEQEGQYPAEGVGAVSGVGSEETGEDGGESTDEIRVRLRALDMTWQTLAMTSGQSWFNFAFSLLGGGLQVGFGIYMATQSGPAAAFGGIWIGMGGLALVSPLIRLLLQPNAGTPAMRYLGMADTTRAEALAKMRYGEEQLEAYANGWFTMRMVNASVNVASSVAIAGVMGWVVSNNSASSGWGWSNPFTYVMFIAPAYALISGLITFATPSGAERRWMMYQRMRDQLRARRLRGENVSEDEVPIPQPAGPSFSFGLAPDPRGGGFATIAGRF